VASTWLNPGPLSSHGFEVELERRWDNGTRLRASYVGQSTTDQFGKTPPNVARDLAKLNLAVPFSLAGQPVEAGLGLRHIGPRPGKDGVDQAAALIGDLTMSTRWHNWSALASVRNIDQASYNHVSYGYGLAGIYPEDGRTFWLQLQYDFR
jgi:outer membrane receptor protein involved in Fe transport